jgi:hypothetical protein
VVDSAGAISAGGGASVVAGACGVAAGAVSDFGVLPWSQAVTASASSAMDASAVNVP